MGFFGSLVSASLKTVLTPIAIVADVVDVVQGEEATTTGRHLDSIANDIGDALDDV